MIFIILFVKLFCHKPLALFLNPILANKLHWKTLPLRMAGRGGNVGG